MKKISYFKKIIYLLGSEKKSLIFLILLFFISSLLDLVGLGLIGPYIAIVVDPSLLKSKFYFFVKIINRDTNQILVIIGYFILFILFLKTYLLIIVNKYVIKYGQRQRVLLSKKLMKTFQNIDYNLFIKKETSEFISSISGYTNQYSSLLQITLQLLSNLLVAFFIFLLLAYQNLFALSILLLMSITLIVIYDVVFKKKITMIGFELNNSTNSMQQGVIDGMKGLKEIRVLQKEDFFYTKVEKGIEHTAFYNLKSQMITMSPRFLLELVIVSFVILLVILTILTGNNIYNLIPTLGVFSLAAIRLLPILNQFSSSILQIRQSKNSVDRLYNDISMINNLEYNKLNNFDFQEFKSLTFNNVSFKYENRDINAINNISLKIMKGQIIGFIGHSGSGKTTLVDVILGLLIPTSGEILFNGIKANTKLLQYFNSQVAYIPQNYFIINDTLLNNITFENNIDIDKERLQESLKKANLLELVNELPEGVETYLGENGVRLSGGQRQRVALARAFYHNRKILILDEATSALDNDTEQKIVDEIVHLNKDLTILLIAHRLSTVKICDYIYRLKSGNVIESGIPSLILN